MWFKHKLCLIRLLVLLHLNGASAQTQPVDTLCAGTREARYGVMGDPGSIYSWTTNGGEIISGNGTNGVTINWNNKPGMYRLNVVEKSVTGCFGNLIEKSVFLKGNSYEALYPPAACINDSVTLRVTAGSGWYSWSTGASDSFVRIRLIHDTVISVIVNDTSCGIRQDTLTLQVKAISKPKSGYYTSADEIFLNQRVEFRYTGNEKDNVFWSIQKSDVQNSNAHLVNTTFQDTGLASVRIISINPFGCADTFYRELEIRDEVLFIPNAFTPNNDGVNDVFKTHARNMREFKLVIVNRWGEKVFSSQLPEEGWDGIWNGIPAPEGTYTYLCEATGRSGRYWAESGNITLIR